MRTTVDTRVGVATVENERWSSDVPLLAERLQDIVRPVQGEFYPDIDAALAHGAVELFGGRVMSDEEPILDEEVEY